MGMMAKTYTPVHKNARGGRWCSVGEAYQDWDDEDRRWFDEQIQDETQSTKHLAQHLSKYGLQVSDTTLGRHRRGECRCERAQ